MRWIAAVSVLVLLTTGCSSGDDGAEPPASTSTTATTTTAAPATTSTVPSEDPAVAAARQAVIDAGVMGEEFARTSVVVEMNRAADTVEIIFVHADRELIGATAVVLVRTDDLSVVEVTHYR